ncbi:MAG: lic16A, partial [Firmicutes bacterium]|nr:lic16A [Bacillota bacterium]
MGETKRKKRFNLFFRKAVVVIIAIAMLLQPLPGFMGNSVQRAEAAVVTGGYIDLQNTTTELYVGSDWAGSNASVSAIGAKATITVNNFGIGGSEWGLQYMVKDLGL